MRRSVPLLATCLLVGCAHAPTSDELPVSAQEVVPTIAALFNSCSIEKLLGNYDQEFVFVSPLKRTPITERAALRAYFEASCSGGRKPAMKLETQRVRMLSPESAIATGIYSFGNSAEPASAPWPAFFSIALRKSGSGWTVVTQATFPIPEE